MLERIQRYGTIQAAPVGNTANAERLRALSQLGQAAGDLAFSIGAKKRTAEGKKAGYEQGKKAAETGVSPEEQGSPTIYNDAFNDAQQGAYVAGIDRQAVERLSQLETEHAQSVEGYTKTATGMMQGLLKNVPETYKPALNESISNYISRGKMRVNQNVVKRGEEEAKSELIGAIDTYSDEAARAARNGDFDSVNDLLGKAELSASAMVAGGFWTKEQADQTASGARKEVFRQENKRDILETAKTNPAKALKKLTDLEKEVPETYSPDEWERVVDDIRTDLSRLMPSGGGTVKEANNWLKKKKGSIKYGFKGSEADNAEGARLLMGTDKQEEYIRLLKMEQFSLLPAGQRNTIIDQLSSADSLDSQQDYIELKTVNEDLLKMAETDGMTLAKKQGRLEPAADMDERILQAEDLSRIYGTTVGVYMEPEIQEIVSSMSTMAPTEKAALAISLPGNVRTFEQLDKKNASLFAMVAARGDEDIANAVFLGEELIKTKQFTLPKKDEYMEAVQDYLGDVDEVYSVGNRAVTIQAALNYYASMGGNEYDDDNFKKALEAVTGGIGEVNGKKIELPKGIGAGDMEDLMSSLQQKTLDKLGGLMHPYPIEDVRDFRLKSLGDGRYNIMNGNITLPGKDGEAFILNVDQELINSNHMTSQSKSKFLRDEIDKAREQEARKFEKLRGEQ